MECRRFQSTPFVKFFNGRINDAASSIIPAMSESIVLPEEVTSPQNRLELREVVFQNGDRDRSYAVAIGNWDAEPSLLIRWNGTEKQPKGNPISTGYATWFVIPHELEQAILDQINLPPAIRKKCEDFLSL
jgi:hypothetical protein